MFLTGMEVLVKLARVSSVATTAIPLNDASQQDVTINTRPAPLPSARTFRDDMLRQTGGNSTDKLPPLLRKFRPRIGRAVGLTGLGTMGALAYGMHRSNVNDRERNPLIYAPMQGSMMQ
jgi:hypothetical protein